MSAPNLPGSSIGGGVPRHPGRVAGFFSALGVDLLIWILFLIVANSVGGNRASIAIMVVGSNAAYVIAGVILYNYGRKRSYGAFNQGVIIATSIFFLLSVACWGSIAA